MVEGQKTHGPDCSRCVVGLPSARRWRAPAHARAISKFSSAVSRVSMFEGLLPYQFIKSTFLELTRRHFPAEIVGLTEEEILRLRTDPDQGALQPSSVGKA